MSSLPVRVIPIQPIRGAARETAAGPAAVSLYHSEAKIQPRTVHGRFARWRWALVWFTQLLFYGLAWLPWHGRQALLFDLDAKRFYIFDLVLHPQDVIYLAGLLIISACALFLFTAVAGRLWCGYACPQTVYTEIFLWVERRFEGDRMARLRLDAAPWSWNKLWRKAGKQSAWLAIGLWTGVTFVGYFTPIRTLAAEATALSLGPWETFWILFYGFATYGNAGWMREQVCKYMCPYARFQSAMFDRDTLVIGYDPVRGEPRGVAPRNGRPDCASAPAPRGDCIDCDLCVQVCPTGIDIRQGLQYACIGCAACIDVCNGVMDKLGRPHGLIRYDTENGIANGWTSMQRWKRVARPRVLVYCAVLLGLCGLLLAGLALRGPVRADVVRDRNSLARMVERGYVENVYRIQLMNTTESTQQVRVAVEGLDGAALAVPASTDVGPAQNRWLPVRVQMPPAAAQALGPGAHVLRFRLESHPLPDTGASSVVVEKSTFIVPR
ncbi:MAG: cytochrome c oxidase accessory protein CcoG [Pseudomonadota bacterium]